MILEYIVGATLNVTNVPEATGIIIQEKYNHQKYNPKIIFYYKSLEPKEVEHWKTVLQISRAAGSFGQLFSPSTNNSSGDNVRGGIRLLANAIEITSGSTTVSGTAIYSPPELRYSYSQIAYNPNLLKSDTMRLNPEVKQYPSDSAL